MVYYFLDTVSSLLDTITFQLNPVLYIVLQHKTNSVLILVKYRSRNWDKFFVTTQDQFIFVFNVTNIEYIINPCFVCFVFATQYEQNRFTCSPYVHNNRHTNPIVYNVLYNIS